MKQKGTCKYDIDNVKAWFCTVCDVQVAADLIEERDKIHRVERWCNSI